MNSCGAGGSGWTGLPCLLLAVNAYCCFGMKTCCTVSNCALSNIALCFNKCVDVTSLNTCLHSRRFNFLKQEQVTSTKKRHTNESVIHWLEQNLIADFFENIQCENLCS